jgi:uncharacterized membrane protein
MSPHRLAILFCLLAAAGKSHALPQFWESFKKHYAPAANSQIVQRECVTCHTRAGQTDRNPFGKAVQAQLERTGAADLTAALLQQIESQDSDGDGASNIEEIRAGTMPGDPTSHPGQNEQAPAPANELIPKHSLHPTIVHFPIALFLFGAILDFWAWRRRRGEFRVGAFAAMASGAIASLLALASGLLAWQRLGLSLQGILLTHFILALSSSILMLSVSAWRRKSELTSTGYWLALAASAILVAVAGHFGGRMVYG